jgi:uncharacterized membrane protein YraQ (UPF0718 family)
VPGDTISLIVTILLRSARIVSESWYFVVGGVLLATLLSRALSEQHWDRFASLPPWLQIPVATAGGMISPLHTASFVSFTVNLSSRRRQFLGPSLSFLSASSMMNPQLFLIAVGLLGPMFAFAQLSCVFGIALGLGFAAPWLERRWPLRTESIGAIAAGHEHKGPGGYLVQALRMVEYVGSYFLLGVILGVGLELLLPRSLLVQSLENVPWLAVPLAGWLGIPFYLCGGGAIPLAKSLTEVGISRGAMLAFLVSGQATRSTALASVGCLLRKRALTAYVLVIVAAGTLAGYGFDLLAGQWGIR